jgi:hypothetical protein
MTAEISFDLRMEEEMSFVEGTYRLPKGDWQVFVFSRRPILQPMVNIHAIWESGVTGISVQYPKDKRLNKSVVMEVLANSLGITEWQETHGPDSMALR